LIWGFFPFLFSFFDREWKGKEREQGRAGQGRAGQGRALLLRESKGAKGEQRGAKGSKDNDILEQSPQLNRKGKVPSQFNTALNP